MSDKNTIRSVKPEGKLLFKLLMSMVWSNLSIVLSPSPLPPPISVLSFKQELSIQWICVLQLWANSGYPGSGWFVACFSKKTSFSLHIQASQLGRGSYAWMPSLPKRLLQHFEVHVPFLCMSNKRDILYTYRLIWRVQVYISILRTDTHV